MAEQDYVYHATPTKNLKRIGVEGLKRNQPKNFKESVSGVLHVGHSEEVAQHWGMRMSSTPAMLRIHRQHIKPGLVGETETYLHHDIPAHHIERKTSKGWEPLVSQHDEQFVESEGVRKLREFIQKGTLVRIKRAQERIRELKKSPLDPLGIAGEIRFEIRKLQPYIEADMAVGMYAGQLQGAATAVDSLPAIVVDQLPHSPPQQPPDTGKVLYPEGMPPDVRLPALEDAIDTLRNSPAAVGINYKDTAVKVRQGAFAITGKLTDKAVADVQEQLAKTMEEGGSKDDFIDTVVSRIEEGGPLSEAHLENVFRTNVQSAMSDGQYRALKHPVVSDQFPYVMYWATHDKRVRPEHEQLEKLGLNGTNIYRIDDPTFQLFRPPWSYQCRCDWHGITVEQAAAKGVKEAMDWLERAKTMASERGGTMYEYFGATAPAVPEYVTPPSFKPPPEFERLAL